MPYPVTIGSEPTKVFDGFSPFKPNCLRVVVAVYDGDPDLYAADDGASDEAVAQSVRQYYEWLIGVDGHVSSVAVYRKTSP